MTQLHLTPDSADQRRGACPTLREPMQTGDGLLARLRPVGALISPSQLRTIADLAQRFGNGQVEITARGNVQVRGLRAETVPQFATAVEAAMAIETGLVIETSPLAGMDTRLLADPRPLAQAIRRALADSPIEAALGPKVTVVVDGSGSIGRDQSSADIRFTAVTTAQAPMWALEVGGSAIGLLQAEDAAGAAWALLSLIARLGPQGRGRDLDATAMRQSLASLIVPHTPQRPSSQPVQSRIALIHGRVGAFAELAFGAADASTLTALADAAHAIGIAEFHLAPQHRLIAICATDQDAQHFLRLAGGLGLIVSPDDPRRAVSACIGNQGCASGTIAARAMAETLASNEPGFFDGSFALHVSGCAKGCAHPAPALLTLVGTAAGVDLVIHGSARQAPVASMSRESVPLALTRLAALWRDEGKLGESVAACFKRLGAASIAAAVRQGRQ